MALSRLQVPCVCALAVLVVSTSACTSVMVGPEASTDGSYWVGQSDDGEGAGDSRLVKVPAMDWPAGAQRAIVDYGDYPRYVGTERRIPEYYPSDLLPNKTKNVIGYIPQVPHTHGYLEANYAISNDQGVGFGESTCAARTFALQKPHGPSLLSMYELSRLAAERASTSHEAVQVMGDMAVKYGFYGDPDARTGGESILVSDQDEQWIFHVLAESEAKGGAIWCAQRIPRDHVTIVANAFVIGDVDPEDGENFLFSDNMHTVAKANGWWDGQGLLHFTRTFSGGEYSNKYYSGHRMWTFWRQLAPSLEVPGNYSSYVEAVGTSYPTSAAPDKPVAAFDLFTKVYRDYYQGTKYDLSVGLAAGPFGNPTRIKPGPAEAEINNCTTHCSRWERPIASFRTTCIHLVQRKHEQHLAWFLPGAALSGAFAPVPISTSKTPAALATAHNIRLDRSTAHWAFREMAQFMYPKWIHVRDTIIDASSSMERQALQIIQDSKHTDDLFSNGSSHLVEQWQQLYSDLLLRFSDGWDYSLTGAYSDYKSTSLGYPAAWLHEVGYTNGPVACYDTCR